MIERQHGVGLAAAEVGLELHHRIAAPAGETAHRAHQHRLQALGEVGAAEELDRVAVLVGPFAQVHLPEVGGELGLLVAAAGHVAMGRHHLAPRLEAARDLALDGRARALALFAAHLLVEAQAQQLQLHLFDVVRLGRGNGREQPGRRIERRGRRRRWRSGSWCAHLLRISRSSLTMLRSEKPRVRLKTTFH